VDRFPGGWPSGGIGKPSVGSNPVRLPLPRIYSHHLALTPGVRLGVYEIIALIGEGGMGKVWRAHHIALNRDDALKVLPDAFASDPDRLARFRREAQVLASLNHPNIAHVYGLEQADGVQALVMELVDGETLADRIARGPIPVDEALPIAKQIAEALEAAHEQGIIHRDLKPANAKLRPDGTVKVLDFGLAKALDTMPGAGMGATVSPTITSPAMMTGVGMILGTAAYMAPEQVKGRPADKRSDVWAFGCVLFEMLTGTRAFDGEDVAEVLSRVLQREPEWTALSSDVPQPIRTLLHGCLVKDRRKRIADIAAALFVLDHQTSLTAGTVVAAPPARRPLWRRILALTAGALVVAAVTGSAVWFATRPVPPRVSRLPLASSGTATLSIGGISRDLAITPDGSRVVYVGNRGTQLFVRALDALEPVAVFTGTPRQPFISPDGQWIGFMDTIAGLNKVAVTGGPPIRLASPGAIVFGATWTPTNTIIFATNDVATGLLRVGAAGGPTTVLTRPDRAHGQIDHLWPEMLPGGRAVLFTISAPAGGLDAGQVAVLDLMTGTQKILIRGGSHAHYVSSGHLIYAAAGTLRAVAFDLGMLETRGTPVPVIPEVLTTNDGAMEAVVAGDGTLAYVSGRGVAGLERTLVWVDRQGREAPIPAPPRGYAHPRLSPDGTRVAVWASDLESDIWLWDLSHVTLTRATFNPGIDAWPLWTPDGRRLIFTADRDGKRNLYWQAADGTGAVQRLTDSPNTHYSTAISPDGRRLIFTETAPKTGEDVMQVELDGSHRVTPLIQSPFAERNGIVSPDGRWLAYEASDSGRTEIYVRPFPEVNSGHWQVSTGGGTRPLWARNGRELFYVSLTGAVMGVGVGRSVSWTATTPTMLVKEGYSTAQTGFAGRMYDMSLDGQRFLMIKEGGGTDQSAAAPQIIVVQHFDEELKRLVPTK
jgi:eukaryotic-like serine/threonine-protein kinase